MFKGYLCFLWISLVLAGCHSRSPLPREEHSTTQKWKILGPFPVDDVDVSRDFLYPESSEFKTTLAPLHSSPFGKEGSSSWQDYGSQSAKTDLKEFFGWAGLWRTYYVRSEIPISKKGKYRIQTQGVSEFWLNGRHYFGEAYRWLDHQVIADLEAGLNVVLLKILTLGEPQFSFKYREATRDFRIGSDWVLPDLTEGEPSHFWISASLHNESEKWIRQIDVQADSDSDFRISQYRIVHSIAPGSVGKLEIELSIDAPMASKPKAIFKIQPRDMRSESIEVTIPKIEEPGPYRRSFRSPKDKSLQYYAYWRPEPWKPNKAYALIVSLHGAHVEALQNAKTFRPKDWAFILSPSDRRPQGLGWNGMGAFDALEAIDDLLRHYRIDENEIYLIGHSMGGQGVLHLASLRPDKFKALSAQAPWVERSYYIPQLFRLTELLSSTSFQELWQRRKNSYRHYRAMSQSEIPLYLSSAREDSVVHPVHGKELFALRKLFGRPTNYKEQDSKDHWCEGPPSPERGFLCVDFVEQYEWMRSQLSERAASSKMLFSDLTLKNEEKGIVLLQQAELFKESLFEIKDEKRGKQLFTENIDRFRVLPSSPFYSFLKSGIVWNGKKVRPEIDAKGMLNFGKIPRKARSGDRIGSWTSFFSEDFLIVAENDRALEIAKKLNQKIWRKANRTVPIMTWSEVKPALLREKNVLWVGSGFRQRQRPRLPFEQKSGILRLGARELIFQKAYGFFGLGPSPFDSNRLVGIWWSSDERDLDRFLRFRFFFDGFGLHAPDFGIFDERVDRLGSAGFWAVGYFSSDWDLRNEDFVIQP